MADKPKIELFVNRAGFVYVFVDDVMYGKVLPVINNDFVDRLPFGAVTDGFLTENDLFDQ